MNIITIGDLHGSDAWKEAALRNWDMLVFIGDYVDSYFLLDEPILRNLKEVVELKKLFPDQVILLWGNHDLAYFYGGHERHYSSGFWKVMLPEYYNIFTSNRKFFQAAFQRKNHLWTHAGVVGEWYDRYIRDKVETSDVDLADTLNRLFSEYYEPLYHAGPIRGGMYDHGGIFWAHASEVLQDPLPGYHQIIGHTKTNNGIIRHLTQRPDTKITRVDCLDTEVTFYELEL
ncbi:MAG: metallophosphoesterase [Bacteroidetes bacterium]|nr:metallophosphoesterase [Bacteroidota bacterium]